MKEQQKQKQTNNNMKQLKQTERWSSGCFRPRRPLLPDRSGTIFRSRKKQKEQRNTRKKKRRLKREKRRRQIKKREHVCLC